MSNNILFNFEGHEVEVINFNGKVLFNPRHVGKCLDIAYRTLKEHIRTLNPNQVIKLTNNDFSGGGLIAPRKLNNFGENFLTTSGVYKLAFKSRKPNAERFQDWVTDEVLPSIEKHGGYIPGNTQEEIEQKAKEIAASRVKDLKDENKTIQRNYNDVNNVNEIMVYKHYNDSECIDKMSNILADYLAHTRMDRYTVEDVIDECGVSYQTIIDTLYRAKWIFFNSYGVPQFNTIYLMTITPEVVFNTDGFNTVVAYFNSKKNCVPKLIYHYKNEK